MTEVRKKDGAEVIEENPAEVWFHDGEDDCAEGWKIIP